MADIEAEFAGKGYGDFKKSVADAVCSTLEQIQKRYAEVTAGDMLNHSAEYSANLWPMRRQTKNSSVMLSVK